MRIAYLGWGDHVHVERWAGYFCAQGIDVIVLSVSGAGRYPPAVRQYRLTAGWLRHSYRAQRAYLRGLLRYLRPDLVHVHWATFAALLHGIWDGPTVITAWGSDIYRAARGDARVGAELRRSCARAAAITCDSEDLATAIAADTGVPRSRVRTIQWGVDTQVFQPEPRPGRFAREFGLGERPVIVSPRNFTPLYNLDVVVEAFARVRREVPAAALLLKRYGGDADYVERILSLIRTAGIGDAVQIVSEIPYADMAEFFRSGTVMVSVPDSDGTPMSLLEAMACGCVPVVSDVASVREWIEPGVNGYVVPARDVQALADALIAALSNPEGRARMVASNLSLVAERASQDRNMHLMLDIYREVCPGP